VTRHAEVKKTELDQFAGRLKNDLSAEVTHVAKTLIEEHAGEYLKFTAVVYLVNMAVYQSMCSQLKRT